MMEFCETKSDETREKFVCIFQISDHSVKEFAFAIYFLEIFQVAMATH